MWVSAVLSPPHPEAQLKSGSNAGSGLSESWQALRQVAHDPRRGALGPELTPELLLPVVSSGALTPGSSPGLPSSWATELPA